MEKKYISPSGLSHYDEKIKEYIDTKAPSIGDGTVTGAIESLDSNKLDKTGDSKDNTTSFTSSDSSTVSEWTDVSTLTSGEKHTSIFSKTSQMFKNVRYLWKLMGTTDISSIGDGTMSGAISVLNENKLGKTANAVSASKLSNTSAIGSATQPVYFNANGVPVAGTYELNKTVPSDAKFTDTTYSNATTSANGLMSSTDKSKLDGVAQNANNYSLPTATSSVLGGVKVGSNITNSSGTISLSKSNVTSALGYTPPTANTDTKNTTGSTDTSSKIFLVGATSQAANPQTYSHDTAYVGTDGCLYSGSKKTSVDGHTHNYAGSSSAGGAATSANKLNTNAGSTTKPVYFSDGVPKSCIYSLNKTVPTDAVFTDTNTWRGIQNNLTSTSTTDSLSAYQGKLLNDKITALQNSGKVYVVDHAKGTSTTISWSSLIGGGLKGSCDIFLIVARSWAAAQKTTTVACISFITSNYINIDILCGGTSPAPTISYTAATSITINWCDYNGGGFSIYRIV